MALEETIIQLKHMGKEFKTANGPVKALDDINLEIRRGEIFGIIGLSGAGKSTLVRCINMLEIPTSGQVLFEGENLAALNDAGQRKARQSMGMIFQQFNLLAQRNILRNVCFPMEIAGVPKRQAKERAMELLKLVGLEDRAKAYPVQLSGGQRQRVAIARALATDPEILYFDEPTSALDPELTGEVLAVMRQLAEEGMTMLVVTHEMGFARGVSSKTVFMENGVVVEASPSQEFFAHPKEERTREFLRKIEHTN